MGSLIQVGSTEKNTPNDAQTFQREAKREECKAGGATNAEPGLARVGITQHSKKVSVTIQTNPRTQPKKASGVTQVINPWRDRRMHLR
jgi:hypothetical protein